MKRDEIGRILLEAFARAPHPRAGRIGGVIHCPLFSTGDSGDVVWARRLYAIGAMEPGPTAVGSRGAGFHPLASASGGYAAVHVQGAGRGRVRAGAAAVGRCGNSRRRGRHEPGRCGAALPYVREVTLGEDASIVRSSAPRVMAALRNTVLTLLHQRRVANIAAALRHSTWRLVIYVLRLLGIRLT
ncbi:MAG: hypothetical protein ABI068_11315 [Ktedonobacterales bacterium]